jgi:hypothetical protein
MGVSDGYIHDASDLIGHPQRGIMYNPSQLGDTNRCGIFAWDMET